MRRFIWLLNIVLALSLLVAGCKPAPTPTHKVEVTRIVEKEVEIVAEWFADEGQGRLPGRALRKANHERMQIGSRLGRTI